MIFEPTVTLSGIGAIVSVAVGVSAIIGQQRKVRRDNEADGRARTEELKEEFRLGQTSLGDRVTKIEAKIGDFMPRSEIERGINAESVARVAGDESIRMAADRQHSELVAVRVEQGRLDQQMKGMTSAVAKVEDLLREFMREVNGKLDKQQETLTSLFREKGH